MPDNRPLSYGPSSFASSHSTHLGILSTAWRIPSSSEPPIKMIQRRFWRVSPWLASLRFCASLATCWVCCRDVPWLARKNDGDCCMGSWFDGVGRHSNSHDQNLITRGDYPFQAICSSWARAWSAQPLTCTGWLKRSMIIQIL